MASAKASQDPAQLLSSIVAAPQTWLLCTDFDGTLAPIVDDPMAARPADGAINALDRLTAFLKAIAVITGRDVRTVHQLAGLASLRGRENFIAIGQYGVERWNAHDDDFLIPEQPDEIIAAITEIEELIAAHPDLDGVHIEDKKLAVGVHTRRAQQPAAAFATLEPQLREIAARHRLHAEPGKFVLELRAAKHSKGDAVRSLIDEFQPDGLIFLGDDLGDLAAFDVLDDWRSSGKPAAKIAVASDEQPAVAKRADIVFPDQPHLVEWLTSLADALEGDE